MTDFYKRDPDAPPGFFATEAAGLAWLAAPGAVPVVRVLDHGHDFLRLERLESARPARQAAQEFGSNLARMHGAGAPGFGWAPAPDAWFGPLDAPFEVPVTAHEQFTPFWVDDRLRPMATATKDTLGAAAGVVMAAIDAVATGAFDGIAGTEAQTPARVHGDLWSGNLLWTPHGGTLIDPAAHGGHRLEDLALLSLFGAPYLQEIFAGYERAHPLPGDWQQDLPAHLFFALLAHVYLFGAGFVAQTQQMAHRIMVRAEKLGA